MLTHALPTLAPLAPAGAPSGLSLIPPALGSPPPCLHPHPYPRRPHRSGPMIRIRRPSSRGRGCHPLRHRAIVTHAACPRCTTWPVRSARRHHGRHAGAPYHVGKPATPPPAAAPPARSTRARHRPFAAECSCKLMPTAPRWPLRGHPQPRRAASRPPRRGCAACTVPLAHWRGVSPPPPPLISPRPPPHHRHARRHPSSLRPRARHTTKSARAARVVRRARRVRAPHPGRHRAAPPTSFRRWRTAAVRRHSRCRPAGAFRKRIRPRPDRAPRWSDPISFTVIRDLN